jgi:hypothetical protein
VALTAVGDVGDVGDVAVAAAAGGGAVVMRKRDVYAVISVIF